MKRTKYGVPYQGNKQKIAKDILENLPSGKRLVDLFGGGGAVTDYAITNYSNKWDKFLYNDINSLVTTLFDDAVNGKYNNYKPKWISREEFDLKKDTDGYIKYIWSFGNNGKAYMFSKKLEEFKKNAHNYIVFDDKDCLKYLENHYKDSYYWLIKEIYKEDSSIRDNRLRYRNIILKLEAIRVCVEYGDKHVYNCFKDYKFNDFLKLSSKLLCRVIDFCCPDIPKKKYKSNKKVSCLSFDEFNSIEYLRDNFDYYNGNNKLQGLIQLEKIERLQDLEQLEILDRLQGLTQLKELQQLERLQHLERLEQLQGLQLLQASQNLQRLEQLQQLDNSQKINKLQITNMDYRNYEYQDGDIVYCDIPYKNTSNPYDEEFNHDEFFKWCKEQDYPIFFSEYNTNIIGKVIWSKDKISFNNISKRTETLQRIN